MPSIGLLGLGGLAEGLKSGLIEYNRQKDRLDARAEKEKANDIKDQYLQMTLEQQGMYRDPSTGETKYKPEFAEAKLKEAQARGADAQFKIDQHDPKSESSRRLREVMRGLLPPPRNAPKNSPMFRIPQAEQEGAIGLEEPQDIDREPSGAVDEMSAAELGLIRKQSKGLVKNQGGQNAFQRGAQLRRGQKFADQISGLPQNDQALTTIDDAINKTLKYKKSSMGGVGTGPIATFGGNKKYVSQELENLDSLYNTVGIKNLVKTFNGMSKAVDSNAERAAWNSTQPNIKLDDPTNLQILFGLKASALKDRAEIEAQRNYVESGNDSLDGYVSPVLGHLMAVVGQDGQMVLVPKGQDIPGYLPVDNYIEKVLGTTKGTRPASPGKVRVISPDGRRGQIPQEELEEALKQGFKREQ